LLKETASPKSKDDSEAAAPVITQPEAFQELVRRAGEGSQACLAALRDFLDENEAIWRRAGDVGALAERVWSEVIAGENKLVQEAICRQLRELKASLGGGNPTPIETVLIDVVGVAWLASHHGAIVAAQPGGSVQQIGSRLRRAECGQRRLLAALKTLALVRSLLPRTVLPG
jgi:hypothetical protein